MKYRLSTFFVGGKRLHELKFSSLDDNTARTAFQERCKQAESSWDTVQLTRDDARHTFVDQKKFN
ncbi:MAG: hypothetical protein Q7K40_01125 [bacterium]|nr:hypothetical protein [bacterium]